MWGKPRNLSWTVTSERKKKDSWEAACEMFSYYWESPTLFPPLGEKAELKLRVSDQVLSAPGPPGEEVLMFLLLSYFEVLATSSAHSAAGGRLQPGINIASVGAAHPFMSEPSGPCCGRCEGVWELRVVLPPSFTGWNRRMAGVAPSDAIIIIIIPRLPVGTLMATRGGIRYRKHDKSRKCNAVCRFPVPM